MSEISEITNSLLSCNTIDLFMSHMVEHEKILSNYLKRDPVKKLHFADFDGAIKSLGAWGGDFVLACGPNNSPDYFLEKGYTTVLPFEKIISRGS